MALLRQDLPSTYIGTLPYLPRASRTDQTVAMIAVTSVASLAIAVRLGNAVFDRVPRMPILTSLPFAGRSGT